MKIRPERVCAYVMTVDSGLAPNPFHGVCTLAVCAPNHVRAKLEKDDWIIGIAGAELQGRMGAQKDQRRLVYAMKIDKCLKLGEYYDSADYKLKIPKLKGSKEVMCGDNFYRLADGKLEHTRQTREHEGLQEQDSKGDRVFIGKTFYYFGSSAPEIPQTKQWGEKLVRQLKRRSVGITYIQGGSIKNPWEENDFREFSDFLHENNLNHIPPPIDFERWKSEPEEQPTCGVRY